jgi:two-component system OmpR family response regulator
MRVLLAEDDVMIGRAMQAALAEAAYAVDWVQDGGQAQTSLATQHYDCVVLDLGLPGLDGLAVLRQFRQRDKHTPVIIVTARDALDTRLQGLDSGADDYVLKPFAMAELLARMRAVLRRQNGQATPELSNGVLTLNLHNKQVTLQATGQSVALSQREYALLHALLLRPGAILSRADLEDRLYPWGQEVQSNAVEYLIHALRRKIGAAHIVNVRGLGWTISKTA